MRIRIKIWIAVLEGSVLRMFGVRVVKLGILLPLSSKRSIFNVDFGIAGIRVIIQDRWLIDIGIAIGHITPIFAASVRTHFVRKWHYRCISSSDLQNKDS